MHTFTGIYLQQIVSSSTPLSVCGCDLRRCVLCACVYACVQRLDVLRAILWLFYLSFQCLVSYTSFSTIGQLVWDLAPFWCLLQYYEFWYAGAARQISTDWFDLKLVELIYYVYLFSIILKLQKIYFLPSQCCKLNIRQTELSRLIPTIE